MRVRPRRRKFGGLNSFRRPCLAGFIIYAVSLSAASVWAQSPLLSSPDTDKPFEISADSLEVQQDENIATFAGNVDARQGNMRLKADRLMVHYRGDKSGEASTSAISRIDASGSVFIASGRETAQGEAGVYDVENGLVILTRNVVLTRGENVIRGDRLVLNLVTGQTRVEGGADATRPGQRVRGLFVPRRSTDRKTNRGDVR